VDFGDDAYFAIDDHGHVDSAMYDGGGDDVAGLGGALGGTVVEDPPLPPDDPDPGPDAPDGGHASGAGDHVPAGHMYVNYEGTEYDAGVVDVDHDHDGHMDTAVIHSPGQVEYYTDRDGDGQADELTITTPGGGPISHEVVGDDGHWHESPFPEEHDAGDAGHIAVDYNGTRYDAGQATVDLDGDGHVDTAVIRSPGQVEYYVDRDGDGRADELTITTPDGRLISHEEADPKTGRWHETPLRGPLPGRS
jgi:hypothetical protein